ncbi:CaiB/BaiF CoA transferase family protein [Candidatus Harpocratesius sp.]
MDNPLNGITIIDLTRLLPGPYCTMILSELGARIIRIEDPNYMYREFPPYYFNEKEKKSILNTILMKNKQSLALNLKNPSSLEIFYKLVSKADVIIESFRPGKTVDLKIDYSTLRKINPSIIYCSLTGYGQYGCLAEKPGHDLNYMALSGNLFLNNQKNFRKDNEIPYPLVPGFQMADLGGSLYSVIGILSALFARNNHPNRLGQQIDVSMLDACFSMNPVALAYTFAGVSQMNNFLIGNQPFYNIYRTKDGRFLSVAAIELKFWENLCDVLEFPEYKSKQYGTLQEQLNMIEKFSQKFQSKTLNEWLELFKSKEACITPVLSFKESVNHPQIIERENIEKFEDPRVGTINILRIPVRFSHFSLQSLKESPKIGENTKEILLEFGFHDKDIVNFEKKGCFR